MEEPPSTLRRIFCTQQVQQYKYLLCVRGYNDETLTLHEYFYMHIHFEVLRISTTRCFVLVTYSEYFLFLLM